MSFDSRIRFAKVPAALAFLDGWKCIEMAQAYLVLTAYAAPTQCFEDNCSRFHSGIATRIALELAGERGLSALSWMEAHRSKRETGKAPGVGKDEEVRACLLLHLALRICSPEAPHRHMCSSHRMHRAGARRPSSNTRSTRTTHYHRAAQHHAPLRRSHQARRSPGPCRRVSLRHLESPRPADRSLQKSRAFDHLTAMFDRNLQTSIANTTVKANEQR
ncbi:hypothetical protein BC834DRAFT_888269 [Gloeopeniophorella convolvens]|nr:hypothetical protein BC834DRAFT_888269 [Gloeopeniophorella convolvens]